MKRIILVVAMLCFGLGAFAQEFEYYKLPSGQKVIIKQIKDNPIVTIDTWIQTGSIYETDKNNGVAHFLEHLFFKGTEKHPAGEFDRMLESKGAIVNAATSKDFTHYYITIPSKDFSNALELHADMLLNPLIPSKEMEKERKVVIEEIIRKNDQPTRVLYDNFNDMLYKTHPYKREVIGTKENIETITRAEVLEFYNTYYVPSNMITIVIGDVDSKQALEEITKAFESKATQKLVKPTFVKEPQITKQTEMSANSKIDNAYIAVGYRVVGSGDPKNSYALDVLATVLGSGKSSRLYQQVREQKQLAFSVSSSNSTYKDDGIFYVDAKFNPSDLEELKKEIFRQIDRFQTELVSPQELEKAKSIIETQAYYSRESTSDIAGELGYTTLLYGDSNFYENYVKNIKKVSAKELKKVAKKYLNPQNAVISVLLPEQNVAKLTETAKNKTLVPSTLIEQKGNISKYKLGNGATLILNKNLSNDIVAIQIYAKGGNLLEKQNKAGTANILSSVMSKGTKNYSAIALANELDERGIELDANSASDVFMVSLKTTKNQLSKALELLNEVVNLATLDSYEIEKSKTQTIQGIQSARNNPFVAAFEQFRTRIWMNHPYGNVGKVLEKTIPSISKEDVDEYYRNIFIPKNLVISINGNVDGKEMDNYFSTLFDSGRNSLNVEPKSKAPVALTKNEISKTDKDIEGAWIVLGWQTCGVTNKKDFATLKIIDAILGGGMSSRLFIALREDKPLAYQVGSNYLANMQGGLFALHVGTNNNSVKEAEKTLFTQIETLKKEFISDNELKEVKEKILGNYILAQETNSDKASLLGFFEATDRGFAFEEEYKALIEKVTPSDIIEVANKYFNKNYVMSVLVKSEK